MDEKITYGASVVFSVLAILILVINISLVNSNRHLQEDMGQKQVIINRANAVNQANQGLVRALAEATVANNDADLRALLASQGITVKANPTADNGEQVKPETDKKNKKVKE